MVAFDWKQSWLLYVDFIIILKNLIFVENVEVNPKIATIIKPAIKARSKKLAWEIESFAVNICPIYPVVKIVWSMYVLGYIKVKTLWEGDKIWKNLPSVLTRQLFLLNSVKKSGRFFLMLVAFSEKLDFYWSALNCGSRWFGNLGENV